MNKFIWAQRFHRTFRLELMMRRLFNMMRRISGVLIMFLKILLYQYVWQIFRNAEFTLIRTSEPDTANAFQIVIFQFRLINIDLFFTILLSILNFKIYF